MRYFIFFVITLWFWSGGAHSVTLTLDTLPHNIEIDSKFGGRDLLIFGNIEENDVDIMVNIYGPKYDVKVSEKYDLWGAWILSRQQVFGGLTQFYASMYTGTIIKNGFILNALGFNDFPNIDDKDPSNALEAFYRRQIKANLYIKNAGPISINDGLFQGVIKLSSAIPKGKYTIECIAIKNGNILASKIIPFVVSKSGIGSLLYYMRYESPLYYGIIAVLGLLLIGIIGGIAGSIINIKKSKQTM